MDHILTPGNQSNLQVDITCTQADLDAYKQKSLQYFQKVLDIKGFRKGHVPLSMVEEYIQPHYLLMAMYGEAVDLSIKKIIKEQPEYRLIGEPYDLKPEPKDDQLLMSYKIDLYPQVVIKSDNRRNLKPALIDDVVTEDEIQQSIDRMCREHADYQEVNAADASSIVRLKLTYMDQDATSIDQGTGFWGPEDAESYPKLKDMFAGCKVGDVKEISYQVDEIPSFLRTSKKDIQPHTLQMEVTMIAKQTIPAFIDENVKKRFSDVSGVEQLKQEITKQMQTHKTEQAYTESIDQYLNACMQEMDIVIPKTIMDAETKQRKEHLQKKLGGPVNYQKYLDQLLPEQKDKILNGIDTSARESLRKYLVMDMILKYYGLNTQDYQDDSQNSIEKVLYDKIMTS